MIHYYANKTKDGKFRYSQFFWFATFQFVKGYSKIVKSKAVLSALKGNIFIGIQV